MTINHTFWCIILLILSCKLLTGYYLLDSSVNYKKDTLHDLEFKTYDKASCPRGVLQLLTKKQLITKARDTVH